MEVLFGARATTRDGLGLVVEALLVAAIAVALVFGLAVATGHGPAGAGSALAGKASTQSWIELASVDGRLAASVQPSLGDYVTFDSGYPKTIKNPRILVNCYQGGELVFGMGGAVDYAFLLGGGGSVWKDRGGAASCEAILYYYGYHAGKQTFEKLARTTFDAGG